MYPVAHASTAKHGGVSTPSVTSGGHWLGCFHSRSLGTSLQNTSRLADRLSNGLRTRSSSTAQTSGGTVTTAGFCVRGIFLVYAKARAHFAAKVRSFIVCFDNVNDSVLHVRNVSRGDYIHVSVRPAPCLYPGRIHAPKGRSHARNRVPVSVARVLQRLLASQRRVHREQSFQNHLLAAGRAPRLPPHPPAGIGPPCGRGNG